VAGGLMGVKTILNEFLAYLELSRLSPDTLSDRSMLIMTYAMCGFANPGSLGIMIGGLGTMAPGRRSEIVCAGLAVGGRRHPGHLHDRCGGGILIAPVPRALRPKVVLPFFPWCGMMNDDSACIPSFEFSLIEGLDAKIPEAPV
jgi:hypothetical protein